MSRFVLITGGAGFIGSHLADALLQRGDRVRLLDNLEEQVHAGAWPSYRPDGAECIRGDVRDSDALAEAMNGPDTVIHCASAVGVGQSQYEIKRYTDVNVGGTASLLQALIHENCTIRQVLVPTSMTSYGEGCYRCASCGMVRPGLRSDTLLSQGKWQPHCPTCDTELEAIPTPETAYRESGTVYALTKNMQEDMIMNVCRTYDIPATALRLFNVYGPRQSLSNPYTGVSAIFLSRLKNGHAPVLYEDGLQSRDFVSVHDVVRAFLAAMDTPAAAGNVLNIGSGIPTPIADIARTISRSLGLEIEPDIRGTYRKNDVRHCFASIQKARDVLGWQPQVSLDDGLQELIAWSQDQVAKDGFSDAEKELRSRGLQA